MVKKTDWNSELKDKRKVFFLHFHFSLHHLLAHSQKVWCCREKERERGAIIVGIRFVLSHLKSRWSNKYHRLVLPCQTLHFFFFSFHTPLITFSSHLLFRRPINLHREWTLGEEIIINGELRLSGYDSMRLLWNIALTWRRWKRRNALNDSEEENLNF